MDVRCAVQKPSYDFERLRADGTLPTLLFLQRGNLPAATQPSPEP